MIELPSSTPTQFGYYIVAISEQCDVEIDVACRLSRNIDLWDLRGDIVWSAFLSVANILIVWLKTYISETGATFIEVPMTMTKSTFAASVSVNLSKNLGGSGSPKKVISGFMTPGSGTSYCPSSSLSE